MNPLRTDGLVLTHDPVGHPREGTYARQANAFSDYWGGEMNVEDSPPSCVSLLLSAVAKASEPRVPALDPRSPSLLGVESPMKHPAASGPLEQRI